jgi:hypothetical protein
MRHIEPKEITAFVTEIEPELHNFAILTEENDFVTVADTIKTVAETISACSYIGYQDNKESLHSAYNELIAWALLGKTMLERTGK